MTVSIILNIVLAFVCLCLWRLCCAHVVEKDRIRAQANHDYQELLKRHTAELKKMEGR